jgi:hypothetical protein
MDGLRVFLMTSRGAVVPGGLEGVLRATEFYPDPADWR